MTDRLDEFDDLEAQAHEPESHPTPPPPSGWHPVNVGHLVMGVAFLGLAAVWMLVATDAVELSRNQWVLPAPWIVAGLIGLAAAAFRGRRHRSGTMFGCH